LMVNSTHHAGLDIPKPKDKNAYASCGGVVRYAKYSDLYGNTVIVENGFSLFTTYYHLEKILVTEGQVVKKGDIVGIIGNTGNSTGAHLHWEVRINGIPINPRAMFGIEEALAQ
jgi:murein DD-endopeptidase MepM/ murein hydrolase activator NlpD